MDGIRDDQRDRPVEPAVDEEVARQRDDVLGRRARRRHAVVGLDHQHIVAGLDRLGRVEAEALEGALVLAEILPVQPDIGDLADPVELHEIALAAWHGRDLEVLAIPADTLDAVGGGGTHDARIADMVPGIGNVDAGPGAVVETGRFGAGDRIVLLDPPAGIERPLLAGLNRSRQKKGCQNRQRYGSNHGFTPALAGERPVLSA